jgi:replicative DNA helicase
MSNIEAKTNQLTKLIDLEAEKAVLGSCLIDPSGIIKVAATLTDQDFYRVGHQAVFAAMLALADRQKPIDAVTLANELERIGRLDEVGGHAGITDLFMGVPTALYLEHYAGIVADKATKRRLMASAEEIAQAAFADQSAEDCLDLAEQALLKVSMNKRARNIEPAGSIIRSVVDILGQERNGDMVGLSTGLADLDRYLGGLQKSDLIYTAGRPGMGKSSWAMGIAKHVALNGGKVAFFSLEMSKRQLVERLLSMMTGIETSRLRNRTVHNEEWDIIMEVANQIAQMPLFIDDTSGVGVDYIRREARRLYGEQGLDLIAIDYIGLMSGPAGDRKNSENRNQELGYISRNLKAMARELDIPVICLSQLSRAVETRLDKRPMLSDLRDSGNLEQDADVVLFLYRDDYYNEESDARNIAELSIAKHRHGATGTVKLFFKKELTEFRNLEIDRRSLNDE